MSQVEVWRRSKGFSVPQAAKALGEILGKDVPCQTWYSWERKGKGPRDDDLVIALYRLTNGHVRPDHAYDLPNLRAEAAAAVDAGAGA